MVHIWPESMDGHFCDTPASGLGTVENIKQCNSNCMRDCDAVVSAEATGIQVQIPPGAMYIGTNLFASLLVTFVYAISHLVKDCVLCCRAS